MKDRLIFPTSFEQVVTGELAHTYFPTLKWENVSEIPSYANYISDVEINITPMAFFEWAYQTPAGNGPVLFYCLNLSMEFLVEPSQWMIDIVTRLKFAPKQLT